MSFVYLPAPLLVDEGEGGRPVQLALGIYALYLIATALRAHREYREHLALQGALRGQRDRFEQLSQHDGLTGLLNHAEFAAQLARVAEQCRRSGRGACLLLLDIDHFKQVNDRLGHLVGDEVLRAFAARLRRHFAPIDQAVVARWGGEEFAVLWTGAEAGEAAAQAESFLEGLRTEPLLGDGPRVRASAGVGQLVPGGAPSALLAAVDRALYQAKAEGRDRVVLAARGATQAQEGASSP
nr:GGDEF domain-containing protein [Lysobacter sp. CAU 1642]